MTKTSEFSWKQDEAKALMVKFENFWKTDKLNFKTSNLESVYKNSTFQSIEFNLSVFQKFFKNLIQNFFQFKIEIHSFRLMGLSYMNNFDLWL